MRDPKRIPRITKLLEKFWLTNPDWRLGQLISNISSYHTEDDDLESFFIDWLSKTDKSDE